MIIICLPFSIRGFLLGYLLDIMEFFGFLTVAVDLFCDPITSFVFTWPAKVKIFLEFIKLLVFNWYYDKAYRDLIYDIK